MKKYNLFFYQFLLILSLSTGYAQKMQKGTIQFGSLLNRTTFKRYATSTHPEKYLYTSTIIPKVGYYLSNRFVVGVQAGRNFNKSNAITLPIIKNIGLWGRYNFKYFDDITEFGKLKINFSGNLTLGFDYLYSNYGPNKQKEFVSTGNKFGINLFMPSLGFNLKIYKMLFMEGGYFFHFYYNANEDAFSRRRMGPYCGLNLYISKKNK